MTADINILCGQQFKDFDCALKDSQLFPLTAESIDILQINFGKLCNQSCKHCHVEAGPDRNERISRKILESCLDIGKNRNIQTIDITGGSPELNPHFRWFVNETCKLDKRLMVRCNLTIMFETGQEDLADFYAKRRVEVIASLPYYLERNVDAQRGKGVFNKSIKALKLLNRIGYGHEDKNLILNLVYNPAGAFLPPSQSAIETDFKHELDSRYGIKFNNLFTIVNMPIGRYLRFLIDSSNLESYMNRLIKAYNPQAASSVMCRYTLSVGWDGRLYDCDFNQMLNLNCDHGVPAHLDEFDFKKLQSRKIITGLHCYGCTVGAGSSCVGAVV